MYNNNGEIMPKSLNHMNCWNCNFEGHQFQIHVSESYLRVNDIGQLVFVCVKCKDSLVDPMVIRNFKKMFAKRAKGE